MCVLPCCCCPSFLSWLVEFGDTERVRRSGGPWEETEAVANNLEAVDGKIPDRERKVHKIKKQLFNRHGWNLAIFPGGFVKGVREAFNPYSVLELTAGDVGEVRIRGVETDLFLAMDSKGMLVGVADGMDEGTVFIERRLDPYIAYLSRKYAHHGWHVGLRKSGQVKPGRLTVHPWGQLAIKFLHRRAQAEPHPRKQLENRHGWRLTIQTDGYVKGTREQWHPLAVLEVSPGPEDGTVRLLGVEAGLYLAMNRKGELYGSHDSNDPSCLFIEESEGSAHTYLSHRYAHQGWHVGIKRSGIPKNGKKTTFPARQKAIEFLHKPAYRVPTSINTDQFKENLSAPIAFIDDDLEEDGVLGL